MKRQRQQNLSPLSESQLMITDKRWWVKVLIDLKLCHKIRLYIHLSISKQRAVVIIVVK